MNIISQYKKHYRTFFLIAFIVSLIACSQKALTPGLPSLQTQQIHLTQKNIKLLSQDNLFFKDHNKNLTIDRYEDWRLTASERVEDLLSRMTLEEKVGQMLHAEAPFADPTDWHPKHYDHQVAKDYVLNRHISAMNTRLASDPKTMAQENNQIQALAEQTRLGVPVTLSTDPRHHFQGTAGASIAAQGFSQWPELLGFASLNDQSLMEHFGKIAAAEYRAVGLHMALSPQADLATEPRWPRVNGTFGEDAALAKRLVYAYVKGFQGGDTGLSSESVATVVKHWTGYGAAANQGFDSHNYYGRYAAFPGDNFAYHMIPFEGAFDAGVSSVMPAYSILQNLVFQGEEIEQVGVGYNRYLLTDVLRGQYGFQGMILSDWSITADCPKACIEGGIDGRQQTWDEFSTGWGVQHLTLQERFIKGINAGLDQFGGADDPKGIILAVKEGKVSEARIDQSVRVILKQKFELGLFEAPIVDEEQAAVIVGQAGIQAEADHAQSESLVLLENKNTILPLNKDGGMKLYLFGIDQQLVESYGFTVVTSPENADLAVVRLNAPFEILHPNYIFASFQHEGSLAFKETDRAYQQFQQLSTKIPTIVSVYLDRPAVLTPVKESAAVLLGDFGVSDKALMDALTGRVKPKGKLPFEIPYSMHAVETQLPDVAKDLPEKLYPFGYGLRY